MSIPRTPSPRHSPWPVKRPPGRCTGHVAVVHAADAVPVEGLQGPWVARQAVPAVARVQVYQVPGDEDSRARTWPKTRAPYQSPSGPSFLGSHHRLVSPLHRWGAGTTGRPGARWPHPALNDRPRHRRADAPGDTRRRRHRVRGPWLSHPIRTPCDLVTAR